MTKQRYPIKDAIPVMVGENHYFVFLEEEVVVQEIVMRNGRVQRRRVTSRAIETSALLRASDKANAK